MAAYLQTKKRPAVLMYHSISNIAYQVTGKNLEAQFKYLIDNGYTFVFPEEIYTCDKYNKPVIITFDDGYSDNYDNAFNIIKKYKVKSTIFMITDCIGKYEYLTEKQIKEFEAGGLVRVEPHTHNHINLSQITLAGARNQIETANFALKKITGRNHKVFAYPYGGFNNNVKKLAAEYYDIAFATGNGNLRDMMELSRTGIYNDGIVDNAGKIYKVGDILGNVLNSDITAYINGYAVPSANIGGNTMVIAEDLENYKFDVDWNNSDRSLRVELNKNKPITPIKFEKNTKPSGSIKCQYIYTDIVTYLSGEGVESFNISGWTYVNFELLAKYGTVIWDGKAREIRLTIK